MKKTVSVRTYRDSNNKLETSRVTRYSWGTFIAYKCPRCNRFFRNLNLHDKTSRCGRTTDQRKLTKSDKEIIAKVGLDKAIKRNKK